MREERIDAASRAECVAECRKLGIAPTRIAEGGRSGKSATSPKSVPSRAAGAGENGKRTTARWVAAAVLIAAAVAGGVWWWMAGREVAAPRLEKPKAAKPVRTTEKPVRQTAEKPQKPPEPPKEEPRKVVPKGTPMSERQPPKTYRDERGVLRYEGGMRAPDPSRPRHSAKRLGPDPLNDPVFKTQPENEIAMLLTATPGDTILTLRRYDDAFEAEFMKSLEHDVEVTEDDTPARAELKRAMAETKRELAERMKNGEKLSDILRETRSELRRLSDYRRNLEKMVSEAARNPELAEQEVSDYLTAANKMLTENGMKPIKSGIVRKNLLMRLKNQQKETSK